MKKAASVVLPNLQALLAIAIAGLLGYRVYLFFTKFEWHLWQNHVEAGYFPLLYRLIAAGVVVSGLSLWATQPRYHYELPVRASILIAVCLALTVFLRFTGVIVTYDEFVAHRILH